MAYLNKNKTIFCSQRFSPKKPIRSFRDLEVYQKMMECSVIVLKFIMPKLNELKFPLSEGMTNCALGVPFLIAEAHSMRFSDFKTAVMTLEKAMLGCNKMIVYLEQANGLYGDKINPSLTQDLCLRYIETRGKMFRLEKAWQKYKNENVVK